MYMVYFSLQFPLNILLPTNNTKTYVISIESSIHYLHYDYKMYGMYITIQNTTKVFNNNNNNMYNMKNNNVKLFEKLFEKMKNTLYYNITM